MGGRISVLSETPPTEMSMTSQLHDLAVGAGEFGEALLVGALMAAQHGFVHQRLVEKQGELLGGALALGRRCRRNGHAEAVPPSRRTTWPSKRPKPSTYSTTWVPGSGMSLASDRGAAGRQIEDLAARFLAVGGREKPPRQIDAHAPEAPAFGARLARTSPSVIASASPWKSRSQNQASSQF